MIAKIHKATLSDKSEVYDILIEESGVTLASIPCIDERCAADLLIAFSTNTTLQVIPW